MNCELAHYSWNCQMDSIFIEKINSHTLSELDF